MTPKQIDRVRHMLRYIERDNLTDSELNLVGSFQDQFEKNGTLSERQCEILEDIFRKGNER